MLSNPGAGSISLDDSSASDAFGDIDDLGAWLDGMSGASIDREALCHATAANGQTYVEKTRKAAEDLLIAVGDATEEYVSLCSDVLHHLCVLSSCSSCQKGTLARSLQELTKTRR